MYCAAQAGLGFISLSLPEWWNSSCAPLHLLLGVGWRCRMVISIGTYRAVELECLFLEPSCSYTKLKSNKQYIK